MVIVTCYPILKNREIIDMKILLTGTTGLSLAIKNHIKQQHSVTAVSKSTGHDILKIKKWGGDYVDQDAVINCAYDCYGQLEVLEFFYNQWKNDSKKIIVNVGSIVSDYAQTEKHLDFVYSNYRLQKQSLQLAFQKMSRDTLCDIKLINPGPVDTAMVDHLKCKKLTVDHVASRISWLLTQPDVKRLDLWE